MQKYTGGEHPVQKYTGGEPKDSLEQTAKATRFSRSAPEPMTI